MLIDSSPIKQMDRPLLKDVMMEYYSTSKCGSIAYDWELIGIQLEVDDEELKCIRGKYTSEDRCDGHLAFQDMIRVWIKQEKPPPTWLSFVEALERLKKYPEFADHLRSKYCMQYDKFCMMHMVHVSTTRAQL